MVYPWQQTQWEQLLHYREQERLPHAILLNGNKGLGKTYFAECIINVLLCEKHSCCNACQACYLIKSGAHPNLLWIKPEKEGQAIKIDQVREATHFINQTALLPGLQIVVVQPANAMNINAANALLKTLEEPPANSLLILLSDESNRLPATIQSRCQQIKFLPPASPQALEWLKTQTTEHAKLQLALNLAQGAPLAALEILQNDYLELRNLFYEHLAAQPNAYLSLKFCELIKESNLLMCIDLLMNWLHDLLKLQLTPNARIINIDFATPLNRWAETLSTSTLTNYLSYLLKIRKQSLKGINFNKQMLLENLILKWSALS